VDVIPAQAGAADHRRWIHAICSILQADTGFNRYDDTGPPVWTELIYCLFEEKKRI